MIRFHMTYQSIDPREIALNGADYLLSDEPCSTIYCMT